MRAEKDMAFEKRLRVGLVCSHGGHLTEMQAVWPAFEGHDCFLVSYRSPRTEACTWVQHKYLLPNIGTNMARMLGTTFRARSILRHERPNVLVSTGAEIAVPFLWIGKLMRATTVYVESCCRVRSPSGTGRLVYPVADLFLVQWPALMQVYGPKARYLGAVL
jgi:UDP-N-acetylglucosamine:LPS N-acetylglucosamine transferase